MSKSKIFTNTSKLSKEILIISDDSKTLLEASKSLVFNTDKGYFELELPHRSALLRRHKDDLGKYLSAHFNCILLPVKIFLIREI